MALRRSTLTLIFIYVILFFALCAKPISSVDQNNDGTKMTIAELERIKPDFGMQKLSVDQNDDGTQMAISMLEGFIPYIESWKTWFAAKGACNLLPPEIKSCCVQCQEKNLCDAVNGCKVSIESINNRDFPKANGDISGIARDIQVCNDCFIQTGHGEDKDVKKLDDWAKGATEDCLNQLKTAENGVQKLSVDKNDKEEIPVAPSLPKIGVQMSPVDQNNEAARVTIERLEGIKPHIEAYKEFFKSREACGLTPPEAKKCCGQCQKNLGDAINGVEVSVESVKKQDYPKANCDINGIATEIQKCNDCFVHTANGEDGCAKKFYLWAKGATDDCLVHLKNAEIESREL